MVRKRPQALSRTCTSTTTRPTRRRTLLRLAGRYGVGEDEVDDLLRNGVLVDLYPVGAQEHSGRHRELQHQVARAALHGRELRTGDVTTATDSITQYARYCELRDAGRDDDAAVVLKEIEDYNRYDCRRRASCATG